ncbi:MAG: hypothetical protein AAFR27_11970 [Pseudomonadota bacterium]
MNHGSEAAKMVCAVEQMGAHTLVSAGNRGNWETASWLTLIVTTLGSYFSGVW